MFSNFRQYAFRLEARAEYNIPDEQERIDKYRAGFVPAERPDYVWRQRVAETTKQGKKLERVHIVTPPLSEYIRFQCQWAYKHTVPVGEDVRILDTTLASDVRLPNEDFWLFDDETVVRLDFAEDNSFIAPSWWKTGWPSMWNIVGWPYNAPWLSKNIGLTYAG